MMVVLVCRPQGCVCVLVERLMYMCITTTIMCVCVVGRVCVCYMSIEHKYMLTQHNNLVHVVTTAIHDIQVREMLAVGCMQEVETMLGRPYRLVSVLMHNQLPQLIHNHPNGACPPLRYA